MRNGDLRYRARARPHNAGRDARAASFAARVRRTIRRMIEIAARGAELLQGISDRQIKCTLRTRGYVLRLSALAIWMRGCGSVRFAGFC